MLADNELLKNLDKLHTTEMIRRSCMGRKETTTKEDLMTVINLFENAGITYWIVNDPVAEEQKTAGKSVTSENPPETAARCASTAAPST